MDNLQIGDLINELRKEMPNRASDILSCLNMFREVLKKSMQQLSN